MSAPPQRSGSVPFGILGGAMAGLVISLVVSTLFATRSPARAPAQHPSADEARAAAQLRQLFALPPQAARLQPQHTPAPQPAGADEASRAPLAKEPTLEEQRARELDNHHLALEKHASEAIDGTWAADAQRSLTQHLTSLAESNGAKVASVDCRTATCVARVLFDTYGKARLDWPNILYPFNPLRCAWEMTLEDPANGADHEFAVDVIYDCAGVRAGSGPS